MLLQKLPNLRSLKLRSARFYASSITLALLSSLAMIEDLRLVRTCFVSAQQFCESVGTFHHLHDLAAVAVDLTMVPMLESNPPIHLDSTRFRALEIAACAEMPRILRWVGRSGSANKRPRIETFRTIPSLREEVDAACAFLAQNAESIRSITLKPYGKWHWELDDSVWGKFFPLHVRNFKRFLNTSIGGFHTPRLPLSNDAKPMFIISSREKTFTFISML